MQPEGLDPRVARTRRDVVDATAALLLERGWDGVTHAEVAQRAGYSKATIYTHWPTRVDLVGAAIDKICDSAEHPQPTGNLLEDLRRSLRDFAADLTDGHLDRLLAGVIERAGTSDVVKTMRNRLYDAGTGTLRSLLDEHMHPDEVEATLALLTGAVLIRVSFEGTPATDAFIDEIIHRALPGTARSNLQP